MTHIITHTYDEVRELQPCKDGFRAVTEKLGGREAWSNNPASFRKLMEVGVGEDDIIWLFMNSPKISDRAKRNFACDCAELVLPIFEEKYPNDSRPRKAVETARLFADGEVDSEKLASAEAAAWGAVWGVAEGVAEGVAWAAAKAVASGEPMFSSSWGSALEEEKLWQVNRIIEITENYGEFK